MDKAILHQRKPEKVILHIDRESQYLRTEYILKTDNFKCCIFYNAKGNPCDNTAIESFHGILKKQEIYYKVYHDFPEAQ